VSERIGFVMRLLPGREAEYRARHEAVWPDLLADLKAAGAQNYSIFLRGDDLFAYLEVDDFGTFTGLMATSAANERWQAEMASLIDPLTDSATGFHTRIPEVFHLE
jgi:L-rhamnose mutarotase